MRTDCFLVSEPRQPRAQCLQLAWSSLRHHISGHTWHVLWHDGLWHALLSQQLVLKAPSKMRYTIVAIRLQEESIGQQGGVGRSTNIIATQHYSSKCPSIFIFLVFKISHAHLYMTVFWRLLLWIRRWAYTPVGFRGCRSRWNGLLSINRLRKRVSCTRRPKIDLIRGLGLLRVLR